MTPHQVEEEPVQELIPNEYLQTFAAQNMQQNASYLAGNHSSQMINGSQIRVFQQGRGSMVSSNEHTKHTHTPSLTSQQTCVCQNTQQMYNSSGSYNVESGEQEGGLQSHLGAALEVLF